MIQQFHSWAHTQRKQEINSKRYLHPVFTEASLTTAKTWKRVSMADQWINSCGVHVYTVEYYSAIKKKTKT